VGTERYTPEFKAHLLKRWEYEGNSAHTFEKKIWRWLIAPRPSGFIFDLKAEQRHFHKVAHWAHNQSMNSETSDTYRNQVVPNIRKGKLKEWADKRAAASAQSND
jgi:hypothetical protein